jgi:DeoR/GlpR family transcriptional regulator of sugar metabolism
MTFLEKNPLLLDAIESSKLLSSGQKKILHILVQFDTGIPISQLMELMVSSKQTIHFNMKKLLQREYVLREREMVYIYKVNQNKILEILERHKQAKKTTTLQ